MSWKQFLTEKVLKEPEATSEYTVANNGDLVSVKTVIKNRTFDNRNDLMDLYEAVNRDEKIWQFEKVCWEKLKSRDEDRPEKLPAKNVYIQQEWN